MSELKQTIEALNKAFEDFKSTNDERLAEIEKKGSADVILEEKVDRLNSVVTDIKDKVEQVKKDAESRIDEVELAANRAGLGGGSDGMDEREAAAQFFSMKSGKEVKPDEADVESYREYKKAMSAYMRKGDSMTNEYRNAMSVGSDPEGGYWVEPEMASQIITKVFDTSPMRSIASSVTIGTDAIEIPNDLNEASLGGWVGEIDSRSDSDTPTVGKHRIPVHEHYAQPKATQQLLDDAQFPVESWLSDKISDKFIRTENTAFVSGNGVAQPRGFTDYASDAVTTADSSRSWGVLQYVASGASGAFPTISGGAAGGADDPDTLIDLITSLNPAYRQGAVFTMNRSTEATVRKLKDADGRYLVGMGDIRDGLGFNLLGYNIVNLEDMADIAADSYSIAFGNFNQGYMIVDRQGIRVLRDPYTNKPYVRFYTTKRVGGDVVNFDAIKLMKFASS